MEEVINRFNLPNSLLVITSYPNPDNKKFGTRDLNAVAWHSEKTLKSLSRNRRVIVLAEKNHEDDKSFYAGKNLFVNRVWNKFNHFSVFSILKEALRMNYIKSVFVPFEFNIFGGTLHNLLFLIVLFILRLNGKRITIEVHQVIEDIKKLEKHINITNSYIQKFFNFGLGMYYRLFGLLSDSIIVFEEELKRRLERYVDPRKINVLSLSTQNNKIIGRNKARKKLSLPKKDYLIMLFGYINGYKGIDFMIDSFKDYKGRNVKLILAGGKNPYLKDKKFYKKFYRKIMGMAKANKKIIQTGFVPDNKVKYYFSAADLVVLPYEVFMSASGPFSLALSYGKPVILSEKLKAYNESMDFKTSLKGANLKPKDIFFDLNKKSVINVINNIKNNPNMSRKMALFSKKLSERRSSKNVTLKYESILFPDDNLGFVKGRRLKLIYI